MWGMGFWGQASTLASAERDDAANRIVRRNTDGHPVSRHHFDAESPHPTAQLGQHFMARIYLHPIQTAAVNGDHGALDINQVVLAQMRSPFTVHQYKAQGPGPRAPGR